MIQDLIIEIEDMIEKIVDGIIICFAYLARK
jgi:hypothetical protein